MSSVELQEKQQQLDDLQKSFKFYDFLQISTDLCELYKLCNHKFTTLSYILRIITPEYSGIHFIQYSSSNRNNINRLIGRAEQNQNITKTTDF